MVYRTMVVREEPQTMACWCKPWFDVSELVPEARKVEVAMPGLRIEDFLSFRPLQRIVRLRVGIGRPAERESVERYVLSRFTSTERDALPHIFEGATQLLLGHILEKYQARPSSVLGGEPVNTPLKSEGA